MNPRHTRLRRRGSIRARSPDPSLAFASSGRVISFYDEGVCLRIHPGKTLDAASLDLSRVLHLPEVTRQLSSEYKLGAST